MIHKRPRSQSMFVHCMRIELPYVSKYRSRLNINYQRFQSPNYLANPKYLKREIFYLRSRFESRRKRKNLPRAIKPVKRTSILRRNTHVKSQSKNDIHPHPRKGGTQHFQPFRVVRVTSPGDRTTSLVE